MFSKAIISSARFLKMPTDSQNLYFHLGLNSDDDGVVEAFPIMRAVGSNEDNLRVLVAKGFIKILNDDLVSLILDWKEHNLIRADRKVDSIYKYLLLEMVPETQLVEAKPRADTGKPTGYKVDVQRTSNGPHRLGKDRIGQDSIGKDKNESPSPSLEEWCNYCKSNGYTFNHTTAWHYYEANGWRQSNGNKVEKWESCPPACQDLHDKDKKKKPAKPFKDRNAYLEGIEQLVAEGLAKIGPDGQIEYLDEKVKFIER